MELEFPYQIVAFIDNKPSIGEPVYYGENGWYPQIALKRRFKLNGIREEDLIAKLREYCHSINSFTIKIDELTKPDHMPVSVLGVERTSELISFHENFIRFMASDILSRYPDREGSSFFPHITAEYGGEMVVDEKSYRNKEISINKIFLLKDLRNKNSIAYKVFELK